MHVYCFHGKHVACCDLRGKLETDSFVQDSKQALQLVLQGVTGCIVVRPVVKGNWPFCIARFPLHGKRHDHDTKTKRLQG